MYHRRLFIKKLTAAAAAVTAALSLGMVAPDALAQAKTIKVGVLHSLSGHDGDQRNGAEGRGADGDRRDQRQGRRDGQEARARRRRSGVELAAVRREGAPAPHAGQGRRGVRLLDFGVAQVGAAGVRGAERPPLLPGAVRRRGDLEERVLHRRRAQPAGDSRGRVPDEQGRRRRQALGAARHRLRLSAHDEQDPARVPEVEGRRRQGHRREVHAVRPHATTRRSSPTSRSSRPAARPRWSRRSTATRTCRSTRSSATRA